MRAKGTSSPSQQSAASVLDRRRSSSSKNTTSAIAALRFDALVGSLNLSGTVPIKNTHGKQLIQALALLLADASCAAVIQKIDLSKNCGIDDEELALLTKTLVKLSSKGKIAVLQSLNLGSIGASPSSLAIFIKALP